jgi:hypothetical protein
MLVPTVAAGDQTEKILQIHPRFEQFELGRTFNFHISSHDPQSVYRMGLTSVDC